MDADKAQLLSRDKEPMSVDTFIKNINRGIYDSSRIHSDHLTITNIPDEMVPHLNEVSNYLIEKGFEVGIITEPYPVILIKWERK